MELMKRKFVELLRSVEFEPENKAGIENLIAYMEEGGFFTAPCSGQYHLCKEGGLLEHSLNVWNYMCKLNESLGANIPKRSLILCGLLHDLGKMGDYGKENYVPNILKSGKVSDTKPYETNKDLLYIPHEVRSIAIAERFIALTEEEEHAIYYHNGKYTHIGYDLKETPLMLILHFGDLWSSRILES
jgi:putative nucleotidyltransferase with HDIG domain